MMSLLSQWRVHGFGRNMHMVKFAWHEQSKLNHGKLKDILSMHVPMIFLPLYSSLQSLMCVYVSSEKTCLVTACQLL